MRFTNGGVCAPQGFKASGMHVGVKSRDLSKKDVGLIVSDVDCTTAAVYTKNVVKSAHIHVDIEHLKDNKARAVIVNSGNANACAPNDIVNAQRMCDAVAAKLGCESEDVLVASTGVIGQELRIERIEENVGELVDMLTHDDKGSDGAACAIMTTDTVKKEYAIETVIGGQMIIIGGIAKGSGMIHPNMGTMLCFITTDCAVSHEMLNDALHEAVNVSFNRVSVDGDMSTNDTCLIMANGEADNACITAKGEDYDEFVAALTRLCTRLAIDIASDGEGAKHLITCQVRNAKTESEAETISKSVISSTLTKAAIFGCDANWGRVVCAMGYSGVDFDVNKVNVTFSSGAGSIAVCQNGHGLEFDEDLAKKILTEHDITIDVDMADGEAECTCWGCDITYDYIKINGDYRT
jgi:glutamate N-acetyltransferase/amino-acid N-acetyltransferase